MRVIGSMTTLPKRIAFTEFVIRAIVRLDIDKLYVNIPLRTLSGETYTIPKWLNSVPKVTINWCSDYGPATKLIPTLYHENDPNTRIITFDDDMYYPLGTVKVLVHKSIELPDACLGYCGINVGQFPWVPQLIFRNDVDVKVDWLEGMASVLYVRKYVDPKDLINILLTKSPYYMCHDDILFGSYLASKKIDRVVIAQEHRAMACAHSTITSISGRKLKMAYEMLCLIHDNVKDDLFGHLSSYKFSMLYTFKEFVVVLGIFILALIGCFQ